MFPDFKIKCNDSRTKFKIFIQIFGKNFLNR
jgi:hypothetical protein